MPNIAWNESAPAGADSAGLGAQEFRSLKTAIRTALDAEHNYPSAGGDAGAHRLGSGRPYVGTQSAVSSSGTDGRLMWTSDTSRLFHVGSGGTAFIGGSAVISAASFPGSVPQRSVWVEEWGEGKTASSGITTVSFPNSGFSDTPLVVATPVPSSILQSASFVVLGSIGATTFAAASYNTAGTQSSVTFTWRAIGRRAL